MDFWTRELHTAKGLAPPVSASSQYNLPASSQPGAGLSAGFNMPTPSRGRNGRRFSGDLTSVLRGRTWRSQTNPSDAPLEPPPPQLPDDDYDDETSEQPRGRRLRLTPAFRGGMRQRQRDPRAAPAVAPAGPRPPEVMIPPTPDMGSGMRSSLSTPSPTGSITRFASDGSIRPIGEDGLLAAASAMGDLDARAPAVPMAPPPPPSPGRVTPGSGGLSRPLPPAPMPMAEPPWAGPPQGPNRLPETRPQGMFASMRQRLRPDRAPPIGADRPFPGPQQAMRGPPVTSPNRPGRLGFPAPIGGPNGPPRGPPRGPMNGPPRGPPYGGPQGPPGQGPPIRRSPGGFPNSRTPPGPRGTPPGPRGTPPGPFRGTPPGPRGPGARGPPMMSPDRPVNRM